MFRPGVHTRRPCERGSCVPGDAGKKDAPGLGLCSLYWALEFHSIMVLLKHFKTN